METLGSFGGVAVWLPRMLSQCLPPGRKCVSFLFSFSFLSLSYFFFLIFLPRISSHGWRNSDQSWLLNFSYVHNSTSVGCYCAIPLLSLRRRRRPQLISQWGDLQGMMHQLQRSITGTSTFFNSKWRYSTSGGDRRTDGEFLWTSKVVMIASRSSSKAIGLNMWYR